MTCRKCGLESWVLKTHKTTRIDVRRRACECGDTWETNEREVPGSRHGGEPRKRPQSDGKATNGEPSSNHPNAPLLVSDQGSSLSLVASDPERARKSKANADVFPVVGDPDNPTWAITDEEFAILQTAFPDLDIGRKIKEAWAWVKTNPANRKTAGGMMRFLNGWMGRNQNRGSGPVRAAPESFAERDARNKREAAERQSRERAEAMAAQRAINEQLRKAGA